MSRLLVAASTAAALLAGMPAVAATENFYRYTLTIPLQDDALGRESVAMVVDIDFNRLPWPLERGVTFEGGSSYGYDYFWPFTLEPRFRGIDTSRYTSQRYLLEFDGDLQPVRWDIAGDEFDAAASAFAESMSFWGGRGADWEVQNFVHAFYDVEAEPNERVRDIVRAFEGEWTVAPIPLPAAGWLLLAGLAGLGALHRRRA